MEHFNCDVLVIGSGAAGVRAAIAAKSMNCDVAVISKGSPGKGTCTILSGGVFAGTPQGEPFETHLNQTLKAGRGINQLELVHILVEEGPLRLKELVKWGIKGSFHRGNLISEGRPYIWGEEIINCLNHRASAMGIRFLSGLLVVDIKIQPKKSRVLAYRVESNQWLSISSKAVVLATGGAGGLYYRHDNPKRMLGDGYCLALAAGAVLQDMEFVQFYPLGLAEPGYPPFLIPPKLADCGRLYNDQSEDIHDKYGITERPAGIKARDRLSQALYMEIYRQGNCVRLDLRDVSDKEWNAEPFSASTRTVLGQRYGAKHRSLRVAPLAHHMMGGICIDAQGATSIPGLFAAGEVTGGLHGANRRGGNALTETVVFGARAGQTAGQWANNAPDDRIAMLPKNIVEPVFNSKGGDAKSAATRLIARLRKTLWDDGGILRNRQGLARASEAVDAIKTRAGDLSITDDPRQLQRILELRFAAQAAGLILQGALRREESRGAHFREDYATQDDQNWRGHLQVRLSAEGKLKYQYQPVQDNVSVS
ncbi:Succinate dehydrogenase flavoprotein subunit (EC [Olavius sp. associated proteobacterium Delta 1]|nr:Succinate dehydrogenase flavoprotein subunit (EC [Olavius sp. associated proteobacterium Delta 1]